MIDAELIRGDNGLLRMVAVGCRVTDHELSLITGKDGDFLIIMGLNPDMRIGSFKLTVGELELAADVSGRPYYLQAFAIPKRVKESDWRNAAPRYFDFADGDITAGIRRAFFRDDR